MVSTNGVMDISDETELLIEVDDILDELHILKTVLNSQKAVVEEMNKTLKGVAKETPIPVETKTLENHLLWIDQMEKSAKKADKAVRSSICIYANKGIKGL